MVIRAPFGLTAAVLLMLSACSGGNSPNTSLPAIANQPNATGSAQNTYTFPSGAPAGVRVYVHLPLRNSSALDELISKQNTKGSPSYHQWLTPAQFRQQFGPAATTLQQAASALSAQGFKTAITSQGVVADAPQATVEHAFDIHLSMRSNAFSRGEKPATLLQADRAPAIPAALRALNAHVAAFAPLSPMRPQFMRVSNATLPANRYGNFGPYWFDDLKQAYQYPSYTTFNGSGRSIGILAASDFLDSDAALYFEHEHLPIPTIVRRPVDGGSPPFDIMTSASAEVSLDVQQSGGSAPGAKIVVYEAPDASITPSFIDMYTAIDEDDQVDVVSTSFGLCELYFTAPYTGGQDLTYLFQDFHDLFRQGNAQGISFVNSSGDSGAFSCTDVATGQNATLGVIWPANDPDVTAVGGTNLDTTLASTSLQSKYISENANFDKFAPPAFSGEPNGAVWGSGGGVSTYWSKPPYQYLVNTGERMRTDPDVAMHMGGCPVGSLSCPISRSADVTVLGGGLYALIGTSASSPEFAGLQATQDQVLGSRMGNVNYLIYMLSAFGSIGNGPVFHNDIPGNNGFYATRRGYNLVLGNGTPYAAQYVLDPFGPQAGNPQTPSNP